MQLLDNDAAVSVAETLDVQLVVAAAAAAELCNGAIHGIIAIDIGGRVIGKGKYPIVLYQLEDGAADRTAGEGIFLLNDNRVGIMVNVGKVDGQRIPHIHICGDGTAEEFHRCTHTAPALAAVGVHYAVIAVDNDVGKLPRMFLCPPRLTVGQAADAPDVEIIMASRGIRQDHVAVHRHCCRCSQIQVMHLAALLMGKAYIEAVLGLCNGLLVAGKALGNIQQALLLHKAAVHVPCVLLTLENKPANGVDVAVQILRIHHHAIHAEFTCVVLLQQLEHVIVIGETRQPHAFCFLSVQGSNLLVGSIGVVSGDIRHVVASVQRLGRQRGVHAHDEGGEDLVGILGGLLSADASVGIHRHRVIADEEGYRLLGIVFPNAIQLQDFVASHMGSKLVPGQGGVGTQNDIAVAYAPAHEADHPGKTRGVSVDRSLDFLLGHIADTAIGTIFHNVILCGLCQARKGGFGSYRHTADSGEIDIIVDLQAGIYYSESSGFFDRHLGSAPVFGSTFHPHISGREHYLCSTLHSHDGFSAVCVLERDGIEPQRISTVIHQTNISGTAGLAVGAPIVVVAKDKVAVRYVRLFKGIGIIVCVPFEVYVAGRQVRSQHAVIQRKNFCQRLLCAIAGSVLIVFVRLDIKLQLAYRSPPIVQIDVVVAPVVIGRGALPQ